MEEGLLEQLHATAQVIVDDEDWCPVFGMMDGDDAIRQGFRRVFKWSLFRICQFHLTRAMRTRLRSYFGVSDRGKDLANKALRCVEAAQRCDHKTKWPRYYEKLKQDFKAVAEMGGLDAEETWVKFDQYLTEEWFSDRWRQGCCDYGLPTGQTKQLYLSTNNYTEKSFCTFDRAFLCARANKR